MSNSNQVVNLRNYISVPWYSADEWKHVFKLIFGPKSNETCKKDALKILLVWKSRCSKLPFGIESTLGLLEVDLQIPIVESDSSIPDSLLRLMYSSVIMRFINHTLDDVSKNSGLTLLQAGPEVNIPQWVVNLRHETAHGHELPSLSLLKNAASFAMNWLFTSYWMPHNELISNFVVSKNTLRDNFECELADHIRNHNLLAVFCHHKFRIKKLFEIPEEDMRNSIFSFINQHVTKPKHKVFMDVSIKDALASTIKIMDTFLQKTKRSKSDDCFAKLMLDEQSLFMAMDIDGSDNNEEQRLPNDYIIIWKPVLTFLHARDMLAAFVKNLLSLVQSDAESPERRLRAAHWIKEIAIGLYKSALFKSISFGFNRQSPNVTTDSVRHLIHHHPNQKKGLTLDLLHPVPAELSSKDLMFEVMTNANPYLKIYIKEMLALIDKKLPQTSIQNLINLVEIVSGKKSGDSINMDIYTVSDVTMENGVESNKETDTNETESTRNSLPVNGISSLDNYLKAESNWKRASVDYEWGKYPIGVLPWQITLNSINPTLPSY